MKKRFIMIGAMALAAALPTLADTDPYGNAIFTYTEDGVQKTYQFWVSGDMAEVATKSNSCASASSCASFSSGSLTASTPAVPLEARYRTWLESDGTTVYSTKFKGCKILFF